MNVMIVGAGEVGFHIADRLCREGHDVTIVERDAEHARHLRNTLNALVVEGNGASIETLEEARIGAMQLFIAVTDLDEVNLITCLLAHDYRVPRIIARIKTLEYTSGEWKRNAEKLGIGMIINPQMVVTEDICHSVSYTAASEVVEFARGRVVFLGYPIGPTSPLADISMQTLGEIRGLYRMIVTGINRNGVTITPRGHDVVKTGDTLYFVCNKRDLPAITDLFGFEERITKNIFILGGGKIGRQVAVKLAALRYRVKIIDSSRVVCEELASRLDDIHVLHAAGTDIEALKNEGLEKADVFIAVTGDDHSNILCSLLAKRHGAKRAIALVDQPVYVSLTHSLGVDICISPRLATASAILKYVRQAEVVSMAVVEQSDSEVIEFSLPANSSILYQPLKSLDIPEGAIVGAIVRGDEGIVPSGDDCFEAGDHVIVFSLPEAAAAVSKFFS
ncbi:MAG: Trk system potassium transporter TrkA [Pirellulaceae bacterium]